MNFLTIYELLDFAKTKDVCLVVQNNNLLVDAPHGVLTKELKSYLLEYKQELILALSNYGLSQNELREEAEDGWEDIKDGQNALIAFANAIYVIRIREQGEIPSTYTSTAECVGCGLIPIPPELRNNGKVLFCPWCWNRISGLPIPKPA